MTIAEALLQEVFSSVLREITPAVLKILKKAALDIAEFAAREGNGGDHMLSSLLGKLVEMIDGNNQEE